MRKIFETYRAVLIVLLFFLIANIALAGFIVARATSSQNIEIYFLDVGQGDSQLVILPDSNGGKGGIRVLIDGGPSNARILAELDDILGGQDRYLDMIVMTHPQEDHFGGLIDVIKNYDVGTFISSGRKTDAQSYQNLIQLLSEKEISYISLSEGDVITYGDSYFSVLGPAKKFITSNDLNDSSIVLLLTHNMFHSLFTGDIGFAVEKDIIKSIKDVSIQLLKVGHHGSRFASSEIFLESLHPLAAIIQVGKNSYGHPTEEVLTRLENIGANVLRNDKDGTIKVVVNDDTIDILKRK